MSEDKLSIEYQKIVQALVDDPVRKKMLAEMTGLLMIHGSVAYKIDQLGNIEHVEHWSNNSAKDTYYKIKDRLEEYTNLFINERKGGTQKGLDLEGQKNCK